jgi:putative ABC transport system ATP-binding protein
MSVHDDTNVLASSHGGLTTPLIVVEEVHKVYGEGAVAEHALRGVSLRIDRGEYVAIMGASGSGKSTLMHIVGCLDIATSGRYLLEGIDVGTLDESQLALVRNRRIGFVFQAFNLLPRASVRENAELPLAYAGVRKAERRSRALAALELVGLGGRGSQMPNTLSGGQRQRAAVARALVSGPALLLADEPTGNLDSQSTADLLDVLEDLHDTGRTIVVVTHERDVAARAERVVVLRDGQIIEDRESS